MIMKHSKCFSMAENIMGSIFINFPRKFFFLCPQQVQMYNIPVHRTTNSRISGNNNNMIAAAQQHRNKWRSIRKTEAMSHAERPNGRILDQYGWKAIPSHSILWYKYKYKLII